MAKMDEMMAAVEAAAAAKTGTEPKILTGHLDPAELAQMKRQDLEQMAKDMGLDAHACKNKQEIADLIAAQEVQIDTASEDPAEGQEISDADALTVLPEDQNQQNQQDQHESTGQVNSAHGVVLVMYNGMVNLRTLDGVVDGLAQSGQTFATDGTVERDGQTWYRVTDQAGKIHTIRADLCRFMAQ